MSLNRRVTVCDEVSLLGQDAQSQIMMPLMHYNNQYPISIRHGNPSQSNVNPPGADGCHYGYHGMQPGTPMTQISGRPP